MPCAYYNEISPALAEWLRRLIAAGLIADGVVDERSVEDVTPADLMGFTQVHLFAGVGVWSYALRSAGWPDDYPVWTGSCPCQPFSQAGKRVGIDDERHLWPAMFWLVSQCRPQRIFGEQVAAALEWLDLVSADLEGAGYTVGSVDSCAAGFGAPHIRQRLYWTAHTKNNRRRTTQDRRRCARQDEPERRVASVRGGDIDSIQGSALAVREGRPQRLQDQARWESRAEPVGVLDHADRCQQAVPPGLTGGFWADAEWHPCHDGKARPTEPGVFPLVNGAPGRVVKLRAYGNAIVAPQATAFVKAAMECL